MAQDPDRTEEVAESKAVLGEYAILLPIKIYPSTLRGQSVMGAAGTKEESSHKT